ncbi:hypothetical protein SteCoe_2667 [Stentor coeruleus]|uniref:Derlin n=1 Tax=Stentor coeruleus TaxID=5963 RepID=A0A1R2CYW5_9CILI|nr:hypothetical protein SteCoe_2667 [Stentor coeruleus]
MEDFLRSVPRITLFITTFSGFLSLLSTYDLIVPSDLSFNNKIYKKYQIWRLLTSFLFFGKFHFTTLIRYIIIFSTSKAMELSSSPQYLYFIILVYNYSIICSYYWGLSFASDIFFMALVYLNSRRNRHSRIAFMGLPVSIPAPYLPFIILAINFNPSLVFGLIFGHIYYYFEDVYPKLPRSRNVRIFNVPMLIVRLVDALKL